MYPKLKKSLGQNFLIDKNIIRKIIQEVSSAKTSNNLLEIGAGSGIFTEELSKIYKKIAAVEVDRNLCCILENKFSGRNINIICEDILKLDISKTFPGKIDIFGNIPYYITGPILMWIFRFKSKINRIFLTVQKEVAQRIVSGPGSKDYGFFSCFVQYFSEPKILFYIKKNSFLPAPKVDSAFLRLDVKIPLLNKNEEDKFVLIVRTAFGQRRKTICNGLSDYFGKEKVLVSLSKCGIDPTLRPEKLTLESFVNLVKIL